MKPGSTVLLVLLLLQTSTNFRSARLQFVRPIVSKGTGQSCAVLDATVMSHAAPSLKDLRILSSIGEVPYTVTISETAELTGEAASVVQVHSQPAGVAFDLEMPQRPYTDVDLDLHQQNFLITATVSGMNDLLAPTRTPLGTFTLFDLTSRRLSRSTVLPLQESAFRYLHVELRGNRLLPESIVGAQVPPGREAQTIYTPVAAPSSIRQLESTTIASFQVPAHVPVERVSIELSPRSTGNFSRRVHITGQAASSGEALESIDGTISSVHLGKIQSQQMALPAVMGVNLQQQATIEVAIENGDEPPLAISSVRLEMRQRSICFDQSTSPLNLFYGDPSLSAPGYASNATVLSRATPLLAKLGPESRNPAFQQPEDARTLSDRRPDILWFLLLAALGVAGMVFLHLLRRR